MKNNIFDYQIKVVEQHLETLWQYTNEWSAPGKEFLEKVLEDLSNTVEELKIAQEELRQQNEELATAQQTSEEQYRNLFENVPTGIYRTTPDGHILMANPALIQMLGYSSFDELASHNIKEAGFQPTYKRDKFKELVEREGKVRGLESARARHDGTIIFVRENARAIRGEDGTVLYYEGTVEDITERKRAEEALKENLAQLSKKNRYETIISTVTRSVHQSINLQEVLENAVDAMSRNIDGVETVAIFLVEGEEADSQSSPQAVLKAHRGYPDWFIKRIGRIPYPKDYTWKTIIEGKPRYCVDTDEDTIVGRVGREIGTKSYVSMPIRFEGKTVGAINISSLQRNAFDEEELKLLEIVAQQIEIAINNAQQAEVLRESEERYRTLVEHTYDLIIETNIDGRFLYLSPKHKDVLGYEPSELVGRDIFEHVHSDDRLTVMAEFQRAIRTLSSGHVVYRYKHKNGQWLWLESTGKPFQTATDEIRAVIASRDITERKRAEEALRENFAQLSKKNRYETIISTVTRSVHQSINLQDVFENAVDAMSKNIDRVDNVGIFLVEGEEAVMKDNRGYPDWFIERVRRIPHPKGFTWKTIIEGKPLYCADVDKDTVIGPAGREVGTKSYASMPIHFESKTVGAICINSFQKNAFDEEELNLLEIIAQQIDIAINNAQQAEALRESEERYRKAKDELEIKVEERTAELRKTNEQLLAEIAERKRAEEELKNSREQLRALAARLQSVREEERRQIAREVHDELGQALTGLKMDLSWLVSKLSEAGVKARRHSIADKIQSISNLINTTIKTVRRIATELRPDVLDDLGLVAAIEWQVQDFQKRTGIKCEFTPGVEDIGLDQDRSTAVFRIFQETLTNIARHANATRVNTRLRKDTGNIMLEVEDNGRGITEEEISNSKSLGLLGMRERAFLFGGEVNITGRREKGTTVTVRIPLGN